MDFMNVNGFEHILSENFPLSKISSMKTGGTAKYVFFPENKNELCSLLYSLCCQNIKFRVIGNASNVLFPDEPGDTVYVFTTKLTGITLSGSDEVFAECGASVTAVSNFAKNNSLCGLEFAYGIPGSVGGGVFMNAGAYGGEFSDVIKSVGVYDTEQNRFFDLPCGECDFAYRSSVFQKNKKLIILSALFSLKMGNIDEISEKCSANMLARKTKQPLEYPSCGSAFKRPEGNFAGKLIEEAGLKGVCVGGAAISEKHAGFIVNLGGAASADVISLIALVKEKVYENSGVMLEPEIEIIEK